MGFDFFTQPRGPDIDISIFGDAATAGIRAGQNLPTPVTAAIEGGIKGYQTGQEITKSNLAIEQGEQLNALRALELDTEQKTHDLEIINKKDELLVKHQKVTDALKTAEISDKIAQDLSSNDPNVRASVADNPAYTEVLLKDKELASTVFSRILQDPQIPQEKRLQAKKLGDYVELQKLELQKQRLDADLAQSLGRGSLEKAFSELRVDGDLRGLIRGMQVSDIAQGLEVYPSGQKNYDPATGQVYPSQVDNPLTGDTDEYEVFKRTPAGLVKLPQTLKPEQAKKFYAFQDSYERTLGVPSSLQNSGTPAPATTTPPPATPVEGSVLTKPAPGTTNDNIVTQRLNQFKELMKRPPQGIAPGAADQRLNKTRSELQQRFGGRQTVTTPTQPFVPVEKSPTPEHALSSVVDTPVKLGTDVVYQVPTEDWNRVNTEPLLANKGPLIKGLAAIESRGKRDAVSYTGVAGLLQVTEDTARKEFGLDRNIPEQNVLAGSKYLAKNLITFDGDLRLALTAYNAGPGTVKQAVDEAGTTDWPEVKKVLKKNLSEAKYTEVEHYADKVISAASSFVTKDSAPDFLYLLSKNGLIRNADSTVVPTSAPNPAPITGVKNA